MSWEAVGAIGEIVGAAGVILSLLYLAGQVRQNSRQLKSSSAASVLNKLSLFMQGAAFSSESGDIWARGQAGLGNLTNDGERVRFSAMLTDLFRTYEEVFFYHRDGAVDDWTWRNTRTFLDSIGSTPGFQEWWGIRSHWFTPEFRRFLEETKSAPGGSLLDHYQQMSDGDPADGSV